MSVPPSAVAAPLSSDVGLAHADQAARLRSMAAGTARPVPLRGERESGRVDSGADRSGWPRVVAIASGKGGVGKTSVSVNLSIALARRGLRVTLVDGDLGTANIDVVCGMSPARRLDAAIGGRSGRSGAPALDALSIPTPFGFRLIPGAAATTRAADLGPAGCRELAAGLGTLSSEADVVVVDAGAGIGVGVRSWMHASDLPLIVATPEPASIADAYGLMKCLRLEELRSIRAMSLLLNQVGGRAEVQRVTERLGAVTSRFLGIELGLLGAISWDRDMILAARTRCPFLHGSGRSRARSEFADLAGAVAERVGVPAPAMRKVRTGR